MHIFIRVRDIRELRCHNFVKTEVNLYILKKLRLFSFAFFIIFKR